MPAYNAHMKVSLLITLLGVILLSLGLVVHHKSQPKHFLTVEPGLLYRSAQLKPENLEKVIHEYGIKTVVSLAVPHKGDNLKYHTQEPLICKDNEVDWVAIPLAPDTPPNAEEIQKWCGLLNNKDKQPILVHCVHGIWRTGMMVAIYQIACWGRENRRVLEELPTFGHDPNTQEMKDFRDFIMNYAPLAES